MEMLSQKENQDKLDLIRKQRGIGRLVSISVISSPSQSFTSKSKMQQASSVYAAYNQALVVPSFLYKK